MPDDLDIKNLRTYEEDIKNALDDGNVTTTDIVMAEQKKRQSSITAENARPKDKLFAEAAASKPKSMPMIFAGLALLVIGGVAIYYGMTFGLPFMNNSDGQNVRVTPTEDVLRSDKTISINTTNKTLRDIIGAIRNELKKPIQTEPNGILTFNILKNIETETNGVKTTQTVKIDSSDLFVILESRASESLMRSFEPGFLIGAHEQTESEPFILLQSNDFEQSFAGMLEWEKADMIDDLRDIFYKNLGSSQFFQGEAAPISPGSPTATVSTTSVASVETGTSTATTTVATTTTVIKNTVYVQGGATYDSQKFVDLVLLNKDARGIQDFTGKLLFFYTFIDRNNLLITTNVDTLEMVMRQINITSLIR